MGLTRQQREAIRRERDRITRLEKIRGEKLSAASTERRETTDWLPAAKYEREPRPPWLTQLDEAMYEDTKLDEAAAKYGAALAQRTATGGGFPLPSQLLKRRKR